MEKEKIIISQIYKEHMEDLNNLALAKIRQYFDKSGELSEKIAKDIDRLSMQVFGDMLRDYKVLDRAETLAQIKHLVMKTAESHANYITENIFNYTK